MIYGVVSRGGFFMIGSITNERGTVNYSEEVIANIVGLSTMECYGVVGMASRSARWLVGVNQK